MARRDTGKPINDNILTGVADDNVMQPFQLEASQLRGRVVRLGSVMDEILVPHDYPLPVAHLVAEMITLATLLSSMLKYEGVFTLQTKGDGPVGMVVADVTSKGEVRGCASFDKERVAKYGNDIDLLPLFLGKGYIAFTVDQQGKDRYQGIVELRGKSLTECVQHYFAQSEQIDTDIQIAVAKTTEGWRAGGVMIQLLPENERDPNSDTTRKEDWSRAKILLDTVKPLEMTDPGLHSQALLMRLFHEEGVRVFAPHDMSKGCRCDAAKIEKIVSGLPQEDIDYLVENGTMKIHCEFCSKDFTLDPNSITNRPGKKSSKKK